MPLPKRIVSVWATVCLLAQSLLVLAASPSYAYAITLGEAQAASGLIGAGEIHSLVRAADGTVVAWGENSEGQTSLSGLTGVTRVAAGGAHSLALLSDGTVLAAGSDSYGQCEVPPLTDVIAIAAGQEHSLALRSNGTVIAWGSNGFGQSSVPSNLTDVKAIAAGDYHSLALRNNGTVVAWGANGFGQSNVPSSLTGVAAIAAGGYHSLALRSTGTVTGWGRSTERQILIPSGLSGVVEIAAGLRHSLALKSDGTVVAWGGVTADGMLDHSVVVPSGLDGVVAISAGRLHSLALRSAGTPVGWGSNQFGQSFGSVSIDPVPSAKDVPTDAVFRLAYSAPIKPGGAYSQVRLEDSQGTVVAVDKAIDGTRLTITPTAALQTDERYALSVPAGSLVDDYGNSNVGRTYYYETPDTIPPTVVAVRPVDGAGDVSVHRIVSVEFSERIVQGSSIDEVTLVNASGHAVECRYSILTQSLMITPLETLDPETSYTLTIPPGAVTDPSGNPLKAQFSSSFTTGRTHAISATASVGGAIAPSGEVIVDDGANRAFAVTPDARYEVASVLVDGMAVELMDGTYTFENVTADHTIAATFIGSETFTLSYTAGAGGTISGTTPQTVPYGSDGAAVTAVPDAGYRFVKWSDGITDNPRADTGVTKDITVGAEFAVKTYTITASAGAGGTIGPEGVVSVGHGANRTFTVTPDEGHEVAGVLVDGAAAELEGGAYTFTNVTRDHTIDVTFSLKIYELSYAAGLGGTVEGELSQTVAHGDSGSQVTAVPDSGYVFVRWSDGRTGNPRTDANVTANVTAEALFATGVHTINASAGVGGTIWPSGEVPVGQGSDEVFTVTADEGYEVDEVFVDDDPATLLDGTYTFTNVTQNATIHVTFSLRQPLPDSIKGDNRYATAIAGSQAAYPDRADAVVIATGEHFADALGGAGLAGALDAPLLLTRRGTLPSSVADEISRLGASKVYILGGTGAISPDVEDAIAGLPKVTTVTRIEGNDRYQTATAIANETIEVLNASGGYSGDAFIATGANFPDALGASPVAAAKGMPVFLVHPARSSVDLPPSVRRVWITGGNAVVSAQVEASLELGLGTENVTRLAGNDRFTTAAEVAKFGVTLGMHWDGVGVTTGANFPDALAAGPVLGSRDAVILLTNANSLPAPTQNALSANSAAIGRVTFFGGDAAVPPAVRQAVLQAAGL